MVRVITLLPRQPRRVPVRRGTSWAESREAVGRVLHVPGPYRVTVGCSVQRQAGLCSPGGHVSTHLVFVLTVSLIQDLNCHLTTRIFMTGYKLSLADILLYYGLHRYMVGIMYHVDCLYESVLYYGSIVSLYDDNYYVQAGITFGTKAQYVHVCRWFDQVK